MANTEVIDRRNRGQTRRKGDARLRALFDNALDAILIADDEGRYVDANPAACALLGYSHAELLRLSVWDLTPASIRDQAEARWRTFEAAGQQSGEHSLQRKDGTMVEVEYRAVADFLPGQHLSILRDITARKEMEAALRRSEAEYRAVIETSPDGFWIVDLRGHLLEANEAYARLSGYSRDELRAMTIADLDAIESPADIAAHIAKVVRDGNDLFQTRHRAKSGRLWQAEINVSYWPVHGNRIFIFIRDVHRRQRSEMLLKARLRLSDIAHAGSLDDLLQAALDVAEQFTGSRIGFFHFVDPDQEHLILQAWSTNALQSMCKADGQCLHYPISQAGIWVECLHRRAPVIHNDYAGLPDKKGQPEGHAPVIRELALPIVRGALIAAIIGVGNKPEDYNDDDVEVMRELASMVMDLVERKQIEQSLRHYEHIVAATPDSLALLDRHYVYLAVNAEYLRRTGKPSARVVGHTVGEVLGEEIFQTRLKDKLDRCLAGELVQFNLWFDFAGKGRRFLDVTYAPYQDETGAVEGVVVNARDITELERTEAALRQTRERLELAVDGAHLGLYDANMQTGQVEVNAPYLRMRGFAPGETAITVQSWLDAIHPDDRPQVIRITEECTREQRDLFEAEYRVRHRSGEWIWVLDRGKGFDRDEAGQPRRTAGICVDITERKRTEERLREGEAKLQSIFRAAPIGLGLTVDRVIREVNQTTCQLLGYTREELIGENSRVLYTSQADFDFVGTEKYRQIRDRGAGTVETRWRRKDGTVLDILLSSAAIDPGDLAKGVSFSAMDITERKRAEARLTESAERLQQLSRRLLSVQEEERRALARELHDDFGQQLAALKLNLAMLERDLRDPAHRSRLADCIQIVEGSRESIQTTARQLRPAILDDLGLAEALHWYARSQTERTGCAIKVEDRLPTLLSPKLETAVFRIVQEAVNNALRHGRARRIDIAAGIDREELTLAVEDDGVGFDPDTRTADGKAGLGLIGMRERVELLGGRFSFASRPGAGSRVEAAIPLAEGGS